MRDRGRDRGRKRNRERKRKRERKRNRERDRDRERKRDRKRKREYNSVQLLLTRCDSVVKQPSPYNRLTNGYGGRRTIQSGDCASL